MKRFSIKAYALTALAAFLLAGCIDESSLYEKINPDALRVTSVFQIKNNGPKTCKYKVDLEGVVMSAGSNFKSGDFAFQDGEEAQDGIILRTAGSYAFGDKVSVYLDGMVISKEGDVFVMTDPDGSHVSKVSTGAAFSAVPVTPDKFASPYQSMYVSLEGWQVIEEDLGKTYGQGVLIETKQKDTIAVKVLSGASFAGQTVAQGSGKISGVVVQEGNEWMIMPQSADDVEFTDERFTVGDPNYAVLAWAEGSKLNAFVSEVSSNAFEGPVTELPSPANCFVVSAPGNYKFQAKAADGQYPAGIPEGAEVYFTVAALGGNTVVAYLDPADGRTVLWTWHIWASEKSLEEMSVTRETVAFDDAKGRKIIMLDRLLGATTTVPGKVGADGLVYQWGRKDPMPGPSILGAWSSSGDNDIPSGSDDWTIPSFDGTALTTVNPDFFPAFGFRNGSDLGEATQSHQAGAAYATTYIGNSGSSDITGYPSFSDAVWADVANPCPAGYHVPGPDEAKAVFGVSASVTSDDYATLDMTENLGAYIKDCSVWFPSNGNRARKNARYLNLGSRHHAWINEISGSNGRVMTIQNTGKGTVVNPANTFNRGNATGVRCVKNGSYEEAGAVNNAAIVWTDGSSLNANISEVSTNPISGAVELPGPANCYVVKGAGTYCFEAKDAAGNWPAGIPEGTKMFLKVSSAAPGNSIVCFYDKDNGKILWTWHIWVAGAEAAEMEATANGVTFLDRLLGATSVTPGSVGAIGLYYQWGRKDPMPGVNTTGVGDDTEDMKLDYVNGVKGFPGDATNKGTVNSEVTPPWAAAEFGGKSHQEAAAQPTTFFTGYTFADNVYAESVFWDEAANPCPAGYTVPARETAATFFGSAETIFAAMFNADGTTPGMDVTTNFGCVLNGTGIWFPNNGNRARAEGRAVSLGRRHFSWDNEISGNNGYIIRLSRNDSENSTSATFAKGNATGVRCVKK